jgi:hypothetical protein
MADKTAGLFEGGQIMIDQLSRRELKRVLLVTAFAPAGYAFD